MAIKFDNIEAESLLNRQGELTITLTDDQGITVPGAVNSASVTATGTISASNFSGSSSGTNTGDQVLPTLSSLGAASTAVATTSANGLMSSTDKTKLDSIESGADVTDAVNVSAAGGMLKAGSETSTAMKAFEANLSNQDDWANSPVSILERDQIGTGGGGADKYAPNLNFHWRNRVSNSLWMNSGGVLFYGSYGSTGVPSGADGTFKTGTLYAGAESITATKVGQWNTAYTDRNKWDGGSTGLTASTGRASLGLGTAATAAATAFATAGHNHAGVYAPEYEYFPQASGAEHGMHHWRKVHASYSNNSGNLTYLVIQTEVPQDNYCMGGFTLVYQDDYYNSGEGGEIRIYGYWNPETNGGFQAFRYECSNPYHTPTIEVCRNSSSGNTAFFISGEGGNYAQLIAKDLWFGYSASSATVQWGYGWVISEAANKNGYTNFDTLNRNDFAAITTDGSTPSLTGATAAQIRTLIGAGTSSLTLGTSSTTALAGNTSLFNGAYGSLTGVPSTFAPSAHNHNDLYRPLDYDLQSAIHTPDAQSGTWTGSAGTDWGSYKPGDDNIAGSYYNDGTGYVQYNVPAGYGTAYIGQLKWDSGGYFDVYAVDSSSNLILRGRYMSLQSVENNNHGGNHDYQQIIKVSGLDGMSAIRIQNRVGRVHLQGMGWTKELDVESSSDALSHWDLTYAKPSTFPPSTHTHDDRYYTETESDARYLQSLPSHSHNDLYYTESEMQHFMARALGWVSGYGNASTAYVNYNFTEDAIALSGVADTSTGAIFKAIRVKAGDKVRFTVMLKGSVASTQGLYLRLYAYNGDMPDGKTHVSNVATASEIVVVEDSSADTAWEEDRAVPNVWTNYERTYTAGADGYVSLVVLNWTGHGQETIYIRQPDIQFEKVYDASNLGGTAASSYLTGIPSNSVGITQLNVSDGTTGQVLTTNGSGTLSFSTVASGGTDTNYYLDGIARTDNTNTLVFSVSGATNQSFTFGANAFNSTTIPAAETYTAHEDTSTLSGTYGDTSNGTKIDTITVDANGHITAIATGATGNMTGFFVEDGDGTEVQINNANEWKFVEGTGIGINWTDTDQGIDSDPYDLTFSIKDNSINALQLNVSGNGTAGQVLASDGDGSFSWVADANTDTVYVHPTTAGNKHIPTGGADGQFLKYSESGTAVWATPSYTTNTDTVYVHPTTTGNKHIPAGGAAGQFLKYSADGTAVWATPSYTTNTDTVYVHPTTAGNKHIPTGGAAGQFLKYSESGTAVWAADNNTTYTAGTGITLSGNQFSVTANTYAAASHTHTPTEAGLGNLSSSGNSLAGSFTATGDITAYSDSRIKENVTTIDSALGKVMSLRGVEYNKIGSEEKSLGVIAQEIREVLPEVVKEQEDGMLSVAYGNITAVLIEAIKEQQKQIEELKAQLDGLTK